MDRGRGARSTVDRRWRTHRSMASGHSSARKLTSRGATDRGVHGELDSGLTGARSAVWRPGDGGEMAEEGELGDSGT
jgi:hypothetical protein